MSRRWNRVSLSLQAWLEMESAYLTVSVQVIVKTFIKLNRVAVSL